MSAEVVFVDDEPSIQYFFDAFYLYLPEVTPTYVNGVPEFIEKMEAWKISPPALFVLDLMMRTDTGSLLAGYQCFKTLREHGSTKNIPVVFLSAYTKGIEEIFDGKTPNDVFICSKPVMPEKFINLVRSILIASGAILPRENAHSKLSGLFDATEIKPGILGVSVDLKKLFFRISAIFKRKKRNGKH